jgi:pyruvate formate lyase activating enzyme
MTGYIHSIESFGTVDGPGVRMVIFFQGCPMRCQYCHNPDTWNMAGGTPMTAEELLKQYESSRSFYRDGGITATGGEPLVQIDFVTELFEAAKKKNIHTCLDTSGVTFHRNDPEYRKKTDRLLNSSDLVMLDIKHIDDAKHKALTGHSNENILDFARYLSGRNIPVWVRYVTVPRLTDEAPDLYRLGRFIGGLTNVKALDVLPYHDMGKVKYENLGLEYPLKDTPPMSREEAIAAKKMILSGIRDVRAEVPDRYCSQN